MTDPDEGYTGPATLRVGGEELALRVRISGHFEPIDGRYRWSGAASGGQHLVELVRAGHRDATLLVPDGAPAPARLGEPDPWGAVRLTGTGRPPWLPT
jgi:hypothetical protein